MAGPVEARRWPGQRKKEERKGQRAAPAQRQSARRLAVGARGHKMALLSFTRSWCSAHKGDIPPFPSRCLWRGSQGGRKRGGELEASWTFPGAHSVGPRCPPGRSELPETHGAAPLKRGNWPVWSSARALLGDLRLCFPNRQEAAAGRAGPEPAEPRQAGGHKRAASCPRAQSDGRPWVCSPAGSEL